MNIITGKLQTAQKIVVYGPEGIGKSTFAAQFPKPLFIDTEGSTKNMDVARMEKPSSWTMIKEQIQYVKVNPSICKTLIIDTVDWAEQMCTTGICEKHQKNGIEEFGYGNGYVYVKEEFGRFLNLLEDIIDVGIHVMLNAHAQIRKFDQPDELGSYDRYELKLGKKTSSQTSPLLKEWADLVLFANYKTYSVAVDDKGKKNKAQGGKRVMYTSHHPCWDAKNRHGLPEELPFEYSCIAHIFTTQTQSNKQDVKVQSSVAHENKQELPQHQTATEPPKKEIPPTLNTGIPKALFDLMQENNVDEWDLQAVVAKRGYYTSDTPIKNYDENFISGVLVGAWQQVFAMIQEMKQTQKKELPFN